MSAFPSQKVSPLSLQLDTKNPRFIVPKQGATEADVILHLCENEQAVPLCNGLNEVGTILPGERVVVFPESGKLVVIEGNRRVTACKMLLDPERIPDAYKSSIKAINEETRKNIEKIEVDVVQSRQAAKKYLAARHIAAVRGWSTIAKMNFVREEFKEGKTIEQIEDISSLSKAIIRGFLKDAALLFAGLEAHQWDDAEQEAISLAKIKPDRYLRLFKIGLSKLLGIQYDDEFNVTSNAITESELKGILMELVRAAFITQTVDTRTRLESPAVTGIIEPVLCKHGPSAEPGTKPPDDSDGGGTVAPGGVPPRTTGDGDHPFTTGGTGTAGPVDVTGKPPRPVKNLSLFSTLDTSHIDNTVAGNKGILEITGEIIRFSQTRAPTDYPIAAAMLTRTLIEETLLYFLDYMGTEHMEKLLSENNNDKMNITLGRLIKYILGKKEILIEDRLIRENFSHLFSGYKDCTKPLNWTVHQLGIYKMTPQTLQGMVDEGLFAILQYMLSK